MEDTARAQAAPRSWDALRALVPADYRVLFLVDLGLPARILVYAERAGLRTLGDLTRLSEAELLGVPRLGRLSVHQMFKRVRDLLIRGEVDFSVPGLDAAAEDEAIREAERARDEARREAARARDEARREAAWARDEARRRLADTGLLASWRALLLELAPTPRLVLALRAGLDGRAAKLQSIGAKIGRSREGARQLELVALEALGKETAWLAEVRARVSSALQGGAVSLAALAAEPWWTGIVALPDALDYLGERLLAGEVRVISISGEPHLARCSEDAIDEAWRGLQQRVEAAPLPAPLAAFRALVEPIQERLGAVVASALWERLLGQLRVEQEGDQARVTGTGSRASAVLTLLRASPAPVPLAELDARLGRGHLPEEVIQFGHNRVGLEQHIPKFARWRARFVPPALRLMKRAGPERQWDTTELLEELGAELELPPSLTAWHLVALLRRSRAVRYLGRRRFVLSNAPEGQARIAYGEELVRILRLRGEPSSRDELVDELLQRTSATDATITQTLQYPPFLRCAPDRYGLRERDLPGGAEALAEATEHVAALLARLDRGLTSAEIHAAVAPLSAAHARWTPEMCMSVLRGDRRFRFAKGGGTVGSWSWDDGRGPSRAALLRRCLDEAGGRVRVETVEQRIAEAHGEAPERTSLATTASSLGAQLRGEWITWKTAGS
jgi:hypothetical protein